MGTFSVPQSSAGFSAHGAKRIEVEYSSGDAIRCAVDASTHPATRAHDRRERTFGIMKKHFSFVVIACEGRRAVREPLRRGADDIRTVRRCNPGRSPAGRTALRRRKT